MRVVISTKNRFGQVTLGCHGLTTEAQIINEISKKVVAPFQRQDYPKDITTSILLYYHEVYEILCFHPKFKSAQVILKNDDKLAVNPDDSTDHYYVLGDSTTDLNLDEAAWRLKVRSSPYISYQYLHAN